MVVGSVSDGHSVATTGEVKRPPIYVSEGRKLAKVNSMFVKKLTVGTSMYIHRQKFRLFSVVGIVGDFQDHGKDGYEFQLSDSGGEIVVRYFWPKEEIETADTVVKQENKEAMRTVKDGALVRVFGSYVSSTRSSMGSFVSALKVVPVTDLNELTMHNLEVIHMMMTLKKVKENILSKRPLSTGLPNQTVQRVTDQNGESTELPGGVQVKKEKLDNKALVLEAINAVTTEAGISITDVQKSLPTISSAEIRVILDTLLSEGNVYTTVDDTHFKSH